jgi:hypothetical protein
MAFAVDEILARIAAAPPGEAGGRRLAAMLRQDNARYRGLSGGEMEKVRGHLFAALEGRALPPAARDALREELRTSLSPVVLAGAARAAPGLGAAGGETAALLDAAASRIAARDEYVRFDGEAAATASAALAAAKMRLAAPCCGGPAVPTEAAPFQLCPGAMARVAVEDQAGGRARLGALLGARPSLIAFFYTRCMNPAKCSLTVTRLAAVARAAGSDGPNLLAISYDPDYDAPGRLRAYGAERGFPFGAEARLLRCRTGWAELRRAFALDVGYGASTVNGHARELFIVSPGLEATPLDPEAMAAPEVLLARVAAAESEAAGDA